MSTEYGEYRMAPDQVDAQASDDSGPATPSRADEAALTRTRASKEPPSTFGDEMRKAATIEGMRASASLFRHVHSGGRHGGTWTIHAANVPGKFRQPISSVCLEDFGANVKPGEGSCKT